MRTSPPGPRAQSPSNSAVPSSSVPSGFESYLGVLAELLATSLDSQRFEAINGALNGEASHRLRRNVPLQDRRRDGAFFTSRVLAEALLEGADESIVRANSIVDPACGAGDLLLPVARLLPTSSTVERTLELWGKRITARDINPRFVRCTLLRLAILASVRVGQPYLNEEDEISSLLPNIRVGDGTTIDLSSPNSFVLLNPPFGATTTSELWGEGRIARAAVFTARLIERLPPSSTLRAILPDVLRSGSNYRRWRNFVESHMRILQVSPFGQFDRWTDVDVFLLNADTRKHLDAGAPARWWRPPIAAPDSLTVNDLFEVRVGTVVPHRDPVLGEESPYLRARDLPLAGEHLAGSVQLRHQGRRFAPPLVAVRRTSRPELHRTRVTSTIVHGSEPLLAENHLLICVPRDGRLATCERLAEVLATRATTEWLNQRLRCRHLTVSALREVPLTPPNNKVPSSS